MIFLAYMRSFIEATYDLIKHGPKTIHKLLRFILLAYEYSNTLLLRKSNKINKVLKCVFGSYLIF